MAQSPSYTSVGSCSDISRLGLDGFALVGVWSTLTNQLRYDRQRKSMALRPTARAWPSDIQDPNGVLFDELNRSRCGHRLRRLPCIENNERFFLQGTKIAR